MAYRFVRSLVLSAAAACCAGCPSKEYVRVPSLCPNDPYCLDGRDASDPAKGVDAARVREFARRAVGSTAEIAVERRIGDGIGRSSVPGALIGPRGIVITAYHQVRGADHMVVRVRRLEPDGSIVIVKEAPAVPIAVSVEKDLAVVVTREHGTLGVPFPVRRDPAVDGDVVVSFGTGADLRSGRVTDRAAKMGNAPGFAATDLRLGHDELGAPVLNVCGEVVGISVWRDGGTLLHVPLHDAILALNISGTDLH